MNGPRPPVQKKIQASHLNPEDLFVQRLNMPRMSQQRKASTKFSVEKHGFGEEDEEKKELHKVQEEA